MKTLDLTSEAESNGDEFQPDKQTAPTALSFEKTRNATEIGLSKRTKVDRSFMHAKPGAMHRGAAISLHTSLEPRPGASSLQYGTELF